MVKEQLTKERIIADIRRSQLDHTPTAVTMTDNCIVWGSAAVACLIFVLTRSAYAFLLLLIPCVRSVAKALLKNEKRKALSANDFSVYTDTMQAVRETVVDVGGCGGRRFRNKTVLQFDSGEWEVPHRNYTWSDTFEMSREGIANTSLQGDTFYVVRLNSTGKIAVAYNEKFFDYKKE